MKNKIIATVICAALLFVIFSSGCLEQEQGGGGGSSSGTAPSAPTGVIASAGDGQVSINWSAVNGAISYNIYWSTTSSVTKTNGIKITGATSPYNHMGLTNGATYYYIVTAVNSSGESAVSAQVSATPTSGHENLIGKIAFVSYRDDSNEIYTMSPDGSNQQRITSHTGGGLVDDDINPVWSPDADKIVFTSWRDGLNELFIVNPNGTGEARLTSTETSWNDNPSWSPDGSRIAFESYRTGQVQIYIMNADGSNQTRFTYATNPYSSNSLSFTYPSWSPDGSKIVCDTHWGFSGGGVEDAGGIYAFSVNTGNYVQLTHSGDDHNAVYSPDGSKIAFYRYSYENYSIYIMNSDGSNLTKLAEGGNPTWSPDGSKIAFISDRDGNGFDLYIINSDGSGEKNLTTTFDITAAVFWTPSWSPDGNKLLFEDDGEIYLVNSDGSGFIKITTNAKGSTGPMWSPK